MRLVDCVFVVLLIRSIKLSCLCFLYLYELICSALLHCFVIFCFISLFLFRILLMMQTVASHKALNRMSTSAVAACMAPLLLRPLLAGDCEIESNFNAGGDGSIQLLKAAAAANHAQAIVITLLEEYEKIFSVSCKSLFLF